VDFKNLFGGASKWDRAKKSQKSRQTRAAGPSLEDLIALGKYDEAETRLKARLKANPTDLHTRLKLAEVYTALGQPDDAVEEYIYAAGEYARDGFFDKGLALLSRAVKLRPLDESLRIKISAFEQAKRLELSRVAALDGVRSGDGSSVEKQRIALELQQVWKHIATSPLVSLLSDDQLKRLFSAVEITRVPAGTILAEAGSIRPQMALIGKGIVEAVHARTDGQQTLLRTFTSGDIIGEGALLERRPWPATYRVGAEMTTLLVLTRQGVEKALTDNPDPRRFLDVLRSQHTDRDMAQAVTQLKDHD